MSQNKFKVKTQVPLNSTVLKIRDSLISTAGKYINGQPINLAALSGIVLNEPADGDIMVIESGIITNQSIASLTRPSGAVTGHFIFDIGLGIPIWYNGTDWVNASGTIV